MKLKVIESKEGTRSTPSIHPSIALHPFVGPWPLLQFPNLFYTVGMAPWTGDQPVARLHTGQNKRRINAHRHPYLELDSSSPSQRSSRRRQFTPQTARSL
jgi:hypothetical protein